MELGNYVKQYRQMQVYHEGFDGAYLDKYPLFPVVDPMDVEAVEEEDDCEGEECSITDFEPKNKFELKRGF